MSDRRNAGVLVVDKPSGPTSHDVVAAVRRLAGTPRVGHAGTLDPLASGVLVLLLDAATRLSDHVSGHAKRYRAVVRFGAATDTDDAAGAVVEEKPVAFDRAALERALDPFRGRILQEPPAYSARRIDGERAYTLARRGEEVRAEGREVEVFELALLEFAPPDATLDLRCSAGTYVRSLARDLGRKLGTCAYLASLRRTAAGAFTEADAVPLERLEREGTAGSVRPIADALPEWPRVVLGREELVRVRSGNPIRDDARPPAPGFRLGLLPDGSLVAVLHADGRGLVHPKRVVG